MIDVEHLKTLLRYEPETGEFRWLQNRRRARAGMLAGRVEKGYQVIYVLNTRYKAHRLAFLFMTGEFPKTEVDHIDRNRANNRWSNLRLATRSENSRNLGLHAHNTSGCRGVYFHKGVWVARVRGVKYKYLGRFKDKDEAIRARLSAADELFGDFQGVQIIGAAS